MMGDLRKPNRGKCDFLTAGETRIGTGRSRERRLTFHPGGRKELRLGGTSAAWVRGVDRGTRSRRGNQEKTKIKKVWGSSDGGRKENEKDSLQGCGGLLGALIF